MKQKLWKICMCGVLKFNDEYLVLKRTDDDEDMAGYWGSFQVEMLNVAKI